MQISKKNITIGKIALPPHPLKIKNKVTVYNPQKKKLGESNSGGCGRLPIIYKIKLASGIMLRRDRKELLLSYTKAQSNEEFEYEETNSKIIPAGNEEIASPRCHTRMVVIWMTACTVLCNLKKEEKRVM